LARVVAVEETVDPEVEVASSDKTPTRQSLPAAHSQFALEWAALALHGFVVLDRRVNPPLLLEPEWTT
jgi:hypothetical protein